MKTKIFGLLIIMFQLGFAKEVEGLEEIQKESNDKNEFHIMIGGGYGGSTKFTRTESKNNFIPQLSLSYGPYELENTCLTYHVLENDKFSFSVYGDLSGGEELKGSDMDKGYKNITKRESQEVLGMSLGYTLDFYELQTGLNIQGGSHGNNIQMSIDKYFQVSEKFSVAIGTSATYYDKDYVDYYYGVSKKEVNKSNLDKLTKEYKGKAGMSYEVNLSGNYAVRENVNLFVFASGTKYSSQFKKSPLIKNDMIYSGGIGINYIY